MPDTKNWKYEFSFANDAKILIVKCEGCFTSAVAHDFRNAIKEEAVKHRIKKVLLDYRNVNYALKPLDMADTPNDLDRLNVKEVYTAILIDKLSPTRREIELNFSAIEVANFIRCEHILSHKVFDDFDAALSWLISV